MKDQIFSFAVVIIVVFVAHGILDQWKSCLSGDFDGKKKRMKSRKASRLITPIIPYLHTFLERRLVEMTVVKCCESKFDQLDEREINSLNWSLVKAALTFLDSISGVK